MKFLMTLNMPTFDGNLVHQVIVEFESVNSLNSLNNLLHNEEFLIGENWSRRKNNYTNQEEWTRKGGIILNTAHIGKVVEYIEMGDRSWEDPQRTSGAAKTTYQGPRRPMRP